MATWVPARAQRASSARRIASCSAAIADADFVKLATGKLSPMSAYMSGKLKLSGKASLAQKLAPLFKESKPRSKL